MANKKKEVFYCSKPEDNGMNPIILNEMFKKINRSKIRSIVIIKDGFKVTEWYKKGKDQVSHICSCTKSITSALIGIAIDEGLIHGVDQNLQDFFPELKGEYVDKVKKSITVKHLLEMTTGMDWPEFPRLDSGMYIKMRMSKNWIKYILERPMTAGPGEIFNYSTGNSHLLSAIINKVTDSNALEYAKSKLFDPLKFSDLIWHSSKGVYEGGTMLKLKTNDMAKFGYLYLNKGKWFGKQIISEKWVEESTSKHSEGHPYAGNYGYHWWVKMSEDGLNQEYYFAFGFGGQFIFVHPKYNIVAAFTSSISRTNPNMMLPRELFEENIIKSIEGY